MVKRKKSKDLSNIPATVRIFFEDEAPRIGSGWRTVHVRVGRKWVFFTDTVTKARVRKPLSEATPIILGSIERSSR